MANSIDTELLKKALGFLGTHSDDAINIFQAELSLPNIKMPTMGGEVCWNTLATFNGYKLQQNHVTRHARILDKNNCRVAWGTVNGMEMAMNRIVELSEKYTEDGKLRPQKSINDVKDELETLKQLLDDGILTQSEFEERKKKVLAQVK